MNAEDVIELDLSSLKLRVLNVCGATFVGVLSWVARAVWLVLLVATRLLLQVSGTNQSAAGGPCCMIVVKQEK